MLYQHYTLAVSRQKAKPKTPAEIEADAQTQAEKLGWRYAPARFFTPIWTAWKSQGNITNIQVIFYKLPNIIDLPDNLVHYHPVDICYRAAPGLQAFCEMHRYIPQIMVRNCLV